MARTCLEDSKKWNEINKKLNRKNSLVDQDKDVKYGIKGYTNHRWNGKSEKCKR